MDPPVDGPGAGQAPPPRLCDCVLSAARALPRGLCRRSIGTPTLVGNLFLVAAGGAVGASARHLVAQAGARAFGGGFPLGTLVINVVGCFLMGALIGVFDARGGGREGLRLFLAAGVLGGFTTFSAFSADFLELWERGEAITALGYVGASVILSLAGAAAGLWLARELV